MPNRGTTFAVQSSGSPLARKITKLVPLSDGGFALLAPYHSARSGFLAKTPVDYNVLGQSAVSLNAMEKFSAGDRVKLSYHADGFAQFSSELKGRVISGRDPITGEPKGLGLLTSPISNPIRTGPTCGILVWGLEDFDEARGNAEYVAFTPEDCYFRGCDPESANAWLLEFFVFPNRYWAGVRSRGQRYVLEMAFRGFEASDAVIELMVVPLAGQSSFAAVFCSRVRASFPSASGWVLNGPGQRDAVTGKGHVLHAFYPAHDDMTQDATSLRREID